MRLRALTLAAALALGAGAATAAAPVQAPHWGDGLFQFYQDRHFDALAALMVSGHFDRLAPHGDDAELLRGGLLLSWGLHTEAGALFERLLAGAPEPEVRDRAWYFLARVRHARGLDDAAQAALDRVGDALPAALAPERALLAAQVALARGAPDSAAAALQALAHQPWEPAAASGWWSRLKTRLGLADTAPDPTVTPLDDAPLYARYNLGVALVRAGRGADGRRWLDALGQLPAATEPQRALRDQANLALGYAALQDEQPEAARAALQRVRLQGPAAAKALLAFGWADLALEQPRRALLPWQELLGRDPADAAVLEARIALPHALAALGAEARAAQAYEQALARYATESDALSATRTELQRGPWLQALLDLNPGAPMAWSQAAEALPPLPHAAQLAPVLAGHDFQEGYKTLRDLQFLHARLRAWQDDLAAWRDLLAQRRAVFERRLPALADGRGRLAVAPLQQAQAALQTALEQARQGDDDAAFARAPQRDALQRLSRAQTTLQALPEAERSATAERLRLLRGRLTWELADAAPEAARLASRDLRASAATLEQAATLHAALQQRPRQEAERFDAFGQRLDALERRLAALLPPLQAQAEAQARALQALAVAALQAQQERLRAYATQARHGLAQLHDGARAPQEAADAR